MNYRQGMPALCAVALLMSVIGNVAPADDPLSRLLHPGVAAAVGGKEAIGPISISDSIIGDIINININVTTIARTSVSAELLQVVVCALNEYGGYGIEMANLRAALERYVQQRSGAAGKR